MKKHVIISANQYSAYDFLVPICSMVWRKIAGYIPVALLTQTREHWDTRPGRVVLDMIAQLDIRKHFIGTVKDPYRTSVQAQASRQHAAIMPFDDDDYLLTSDVDMFPVSRSWFNQQDESFDIHIFYSNAYEYRFHTTGYIGMKAGLWRQIMGLKQAGHIAPTLEAALEKHLTPERDTWQEWYFDETYFSSKLKAWPGYPDRCQMIERPGAPPMNRIDRGRWGWAPGFEGKVDAHVLRPAWDEENWPKMKNFLDQLIPEDMEMIRPYRERYLEARA